MPPEDDPGELHEPDEPDGPDDLHEPGELDELLRALASRHRRDILRQVWNRERGAGELVSHLGLAAASVSEHLKVLRKTGLVEMRVVGTYRLYRASAHRMGHLVRLLEHEFPVSGTGEDPPTREEPS
ncbi:metalloregulator ArsR/SmtB family transcription factor [Actinocrinis sp.]|uniref:ArsR/SmtB family transcription factor n=1 Tax=Actinocrinis sp. TaxID=1920516 RepID=UPI002D23F15E|nr:metalloregulator ArsR/SmtB family transcription factor [Actinocrinis sp.]HZP51483.1 metalloregulator ArsR/SmtB family transcription factor [Actinocrinis sp.]